MSLEQNPKKIKPFLQIVVILEGVAMVGLGCGIWGIFSTQEPVQVVKEAFTIDFNSVKTEASQDLTVGEGEVIASKLGTKYYYPNCSGLGRIKPENWVIFPSKTAAEEAGLELAKNCKKP